jgi:CheY-like chemotaxis protein
MPFEDGCTLISKIRALDNEVRQTPALALTANAGHEDIHLVQLAGFQTHLAKPVAANTLARAIARLAGRTASSDERS